MPLRIAAMWAGQEGTLLIWLLALLVITWLYPWGKVTKVLIGEQFLLMVGFLLLNPLTNSGIQSGLGLNPILQSSWMLMHPPVVFIGYALLTVPFAEALLGEDNVGGAYLRWGWWFLSVGLALGGAWAYRVLGWGGFWAWDPVEAASLVPWLLATIALHLYSSGRARPFALGAFAAVIWAAVVTRSGIFADTSVHAFASSNSSYYLYLLLLIHTGLTVHSLYRYRKQYTPLPLVWQAVTLYALWVLAGTLLPPLSRLLLGAARSPSVGYYRSGAVPAAALVLWSLRNSLKRDGSAKGLAHFGVVLFLIGAVGGALYSSSQTVALESGVMAELGKMTFSYNRHSSGADITAFAGNDTWQQEVSLRSSAVPKPVIWRQLWQDTYISPISIGDRGGNSFVLRQGESVNHNGVDLELLGILQGMRLEGHTLVAELLYAGELVTPALVLTDTGVKGRKALLPNGGSVAVTNVSPENNEVTVHVYSAEEAESLLIAEVSTRPLMFFVRFGVVFTLLGGLVAFIEARRS